MSSWLADALGRSVDRVGTTERAVGERFPLSADPVTGQWKTTRTGSWAAGFWVGQLWLRARLTGSTADRVAAELWATRLARWAEAEADTVTRGLILWYGAAAGSRLDVSDAGDVLAERGAAHLLATFDPATGMLPWGTVFGDPPQPPVARVDSVPGTVPLLSWSGHDGAETVAAQHLRTHLRLCGSPDRVVPAWSHADGRWRAAAEPPVGWSRGAAWMLLALADATIWLGESFEPVAVEFAQAWLRDLPGVPAAVANEPDSPADTSAAAIAAVALCKLGLADEATDIVRVLVRDHLSDSSGGLPAGALRDGCHDLQRGMATRHELVWGDFFLLLALAILTGQVPAAAL